MSIAITSLGILAVIYSFYFFFIDLNPNYYIYVLYRIAYIMLDIGWLVFGIGVIRRLPWARIGLIIIAVIYFVDYIEQPSYIRLAITNHEIFRTARWIVNLIYFVSVIIFFTRPKVRQQFKAIQTNWSSKI